MNKKTFKKLGLTTLCGVALFTQTLPVFAATAEELGADTVTTAQLSEENSVDTINPVTGANMRGIGDINLIAGGTLDGSMAEYITGVPNSGSVALHFKATSCVSVGLLENSTTIINMPDEFKFVALQDSFKRAVTGRIEMPGGKVYEYTPDDVTFYQDKLVLKNPRATYLLKAKYKVDLVINYGKILDENPNIPIKDNFSGYKFEAAMSKNNVIDFTLLGGQQGSWTSKETSAVIKP